MRPLLPLAAILALALSACATQKSDTPTPPPEDTRLPFPLAIYVYDFAVAPQEVPAGMFAAATFTGVVDDPQTNDKREALEHKIAGELSVKLVAALQELGLPAVRWRGAPPKNNESYVIEGVLVTIDGTDQLGEVIIGLAGAGTELRAWAQMSRNNATRAPVASAETGAGSAEVPGLAGTLPANKKVGTSSLSTGVGVVRTVNNKVKAGVEATAKAIVDILRPRLQEQGWF